jgi:hypothetical protein
MNYDNLMEEQISKLKGGEKLLLHACCAPCSSACLERLGDIFKIDIYYYNPNIDNIDEYNKRLNEVIRFTKSFKTKYPIDVIDGGYDSDTFFEMAKGLEKEPERGKRCYKCYELRLKKTKEYASSNDYDFFATTLTLSPYKNSNWINEIGEKLDDESNSTYLYSDFKKKNGYKRSIELSSEYNLYRQDYCGCIYSVRNK